MDIDSLIETKIEADIEFKASLETLDDTEREEALSAKRKEVLSQEFSTLKEQADKVTKAEELANNYKIRAEKAEKGVKPSSDGDGLSNKDVIFLAKADIHDEDVEEVVELARLKKISVSEAYNYLTPVLADRTEKRKTAQATQTTSSRGTTKTSPEELMNKARAGNIPEDDAGIQALVAAEMLQKQARK